MRVLFFIMIGLSMKAWGNGLLTPYIPKGDKVQQQQERDRKLTKHQTSWAERLDHKLNLSDEQFTQIDELYKSYQQELTLLRTQRLELRKDLHAMLGSDDASEEYNSALTNKHTEMLSTRNEFSRKRFEMILQVRRILTPEQRREFAPFSQTRGKS